MQTLYFVTGNKGKVAEAQTILGFPIRIANINLDEIQELDLKKIVTHKVKQAYEIIKHPVFVDDVGVYIEAWNGFPGPFIKFIREAGGNKLLIRMLESETNRNVVVKAAIGFHDGKKVHTFIGDVSGEFISEERGSGGWGFDPMFKPSHSTQTWGEMTDHDKNIISHRRSALEKFKKFLQSKK